MEARIARVERDIEHLHSDIAELKAELRRLRDRIDTVCSAGTAPLKLRGRDQLHLPLLVIATLGSRRCGTASAGFDAQPIRAIRSLLEPPAHLVPMPPASTEIRS